MEADSPGRAGRAPVTTRAELAHVALALFIERGFDRTTVDEIAAAAGVGRRTLFRYFATKNDLPWGEFDLLLERMRIALHATPDEVGLYRALRDAVVEFNRVPEAELAFHRQRMELLLGTPSLIAYSTLRYAAWRHVLAEHVASRLGLDPGSLRPQAIAWTCLGLAISSYEQWLAHPETRLDELLSSAFDLLEETVVPGSGRPGGGA